MTDWTPQEDVRLAELRAAIPQIPCSRIAFFLQRSVNSVVGRVRRLGLEQRPSPIKRREGATKPLRVKAHIATLPSLASASTRAVVVAALLRLRRSMPADPPLAMATHQWPPERKCQFPIGEPGNRNFRFCLDPVTTPGPYCDACRKRAYQTASHQRDAA